MSFSIVLLLLFVLFAFIAILGALFIYIYWWLIQRTLPRLDGKLAFDALSASVEIRRDQFGVPHLYAQNFLDLMRAQGYVHAQDRLWQMEQSRRIGAGRLSELFGKPALEADRFSRIIGYRRSAQLELETLSDEARATVEAYCEGINHYIDTRPGRLAPEFNLLRRQPEPWSVLDVVTFGKVMAWSLSVNWEGELVRLRLAGQLDSARAADLEPDYPEINPIILEGVKSSEAMRLMSAAGILLAEYEKVKQWIGPQGAGQGSNSWVVGAERSSSGAPILCNDPHLALSMPGVWYENHLHAPGFEVSGVSFAGAPGVIIGHNDEIAWGVTNSFADVQDLYIERAHPEDPLRFASGDRWIEAERFEEEIQVRGVSRPHVEEVIVTHHGPLISRLFTHTTDDEGPTEPLPHLALRWAGHLPGTMVDAVLGINRAKDWASFDAALALWTSPSQNFTFASRSGDIAYRMAGQIPIREEGLGLVPAPGDDPAYEWTGMIPHEELPMLLNPESGLIVTANNKMTGDDYPYFLTLETYPGWRAARIEQMLQNKRRFSLADMEQIQLDSTSLYAEALTPHLTRQQSDDPYERIALNMLRDWSYRMEPESGAALVFHYVLLHLLQMTFGDKLGPAARGFLGGSSSPLFLINGFQHRAAVRLLELLTEHEESVWYDDLAGGRRRHRDELIAEALSASVKRIRREVNPTPRQWAWGRMHQIRFTHPMGSVPILRGFFNRGPFPVAGDGTTPNQTSYAPQLPPGLAQVVASYRQIFEVGAWEKGRTVITSGQSGHPLSRHYVDQMSMWLDGSYHPVAWERNAVEEATQHLLLLEPGGLA